MIFRFIFIAKVIIANDSSHLPLQCFLYTTQALKGYMSNTSDVFQCLASKNNKKMATLAKNLMIVFRHDPVNVEKNTVYFLYRQYTCIYAHCHISWCVYFQPRFVISSTVQSTFGKPCTVGISWPLLMQWAQLIISYIALQCVILSYRHEPPMIPFNCFKHPLFNRHVYLLDSKD